ncbi:hypothetical protein Tco_0699684 [Tanacetum coccineum]
MVSITNQPRIVFFDLETTTEDGGPYAILEFESILLSPKTLTELKWKSIVVSYLSSANDLQLFRWPLLRLILGMDVKGTDDNHIGCWIAAIQGFFFVIQMWKVVMKFSPFFANVLTQAITLAQIKDALVLEGIYIDIILCEVNLLLLNNVVLSENQLSLTLNGLGLGAVDYLLRPISADELLNLSIHVLAKS